MSDSLSDTALSIDRQNYNHKKLSSKTKTLHIIFNKLLFFSSFTHRIQEEAFHISRDTAALQNEPYLLCHHSILGIIRLRGREKCLHRKKCSLQGECRAPLVFQDVQANSSTLAADIRVPSMMNRDNKIQNINQPKKQFSDSNALIVILASEKK